ncbi:MAG: DUF4159 domain-containing protein [Phycisphaerae bacterium]|nr:DUF4159 domain-containing protein [Phycisphaerae bacterium]
MAIRRRPTKTPGEVTAKAVCNVLGRIHCVLAQTFRLIGRCASVVIGPLPWFLRLAILLVVLGGPMVVVHAGGLEWYIDTLGFTNELHAVVDDICADVFKTFESFALAGSILGWTLGGVAVLGLLRRRFILRILRVFTVLATLYWLILAGFLWYFPDMVAVNCPKLLGGVDGAEIWRNEQWVQWLWACAPFLLVSIVLMVCLWRKSVCEYYAHSAPDQPLIGDRIYDNVRTHGKDPRYRTSMYWPVGVYMLVLFGPMIMRGCGWEKDYEIPKGSGKPVVMQVQVKRIKKEKPEKLLLNMDSPIIWERPKLKDIKILDEMIKETAETYQANKNIGKLGDGGGDTGGWPHGMANARVRFIRLKYNGSSTWNVNMGYGYDYNLLLRFNEITGFKIADNTEYKEVSRLARFRKGKAPPFVYMTGRGGISLSNSELKILRNYCLVEGGMILADSAGGHFDRSFRSICKRLFPGKQLVDVPDDDPLYREQFLFPNGAPPLWHHNNNYRPQGIKHEGTWVVYYHSGDMGDAWRTGHSGSSKAVTDRAYKLGINIMYYTFTRYLNKHHPPPKD